MQLGSQLVELLGRHRLMSELLEAGLEVATPVRDRGIDLIAYVDLDAEIPSFAALPIRMKAATGSCFGLDREHAQFPGLILAYVWNLSDPARAVTYALTYREAAVVAATIGYTESSSWANGRGKLRELLEPYRMTPQAWRRKVLFTARAAGAS